MSADGGWLAYSWMIDISPGSNLYTGLRFQMQRGGMPFGSEANVMVIGLPKELQSEKERIQKLVEQQVAELKKQARNLLDQVCSSSALLPAGIIGLVWARRRGGFGRHRHDRMDRRL